ncbi:nSTAND1 domain-containing NTPase [Chondromyces apiculatus]|uniref:nSTAND1 domain-containing NTPase n=1 Tax=Chondromyces apiculatus TaxID=51 RepID=UPI0018CC6AFB|nr:protein kinase [Chondromyces apiculatus]
MRSFLTLPDEERVLGPYRLKRQLGRGGFAPVWLAEEVYGDTVLRLAAVKIFGLDTRREGGRPAADRAIVDEARRLCQVEHPNIVRFYALPINEARSIAGLAMEYIAGDALSDRLRERGPLPVLEVLELGAALASALSAVHVAGLVHRDLSPANILVSSSPALGGASACKLIDFGIAAALPQGRSPDSDPTAAWARHLLLGSDFPEALGGTALAALPAAIQLGPEEAADLAGPLTRVGGKLGYVDPVCWRELRPATMASDLYGLAAVLFVCLTGRIPAAGTGALRAEILDGRARAPRLTEILPDAPPALDRLLDALLDPDPAKRPRSAELVAIELERLRGQLAARPIALPSEDEGPFRGLERFEQQHRDVFFGRRVEIAATLEAMRSNGLVALLGPSGSGKSSLARAGVLNAIADGALGGPRRWDTVAITPGTDPRNAIGAALFHVGLDVSRAPADVAADMVAWTQREGRGLVLLVDQLEELTTLASPGPIPGTAPRLSYVSHAAPVSPAAHAAQALQPNHAAHASNAANASPAAAAEAEPVDPYAESRAWTIELLARLGERPLPGVRALVTARRDLLDPLLAHAALGRAILRGAVLVSPIDDASWGEVIDAALTTYGYTFEDEALRDELLAGLQSTARAMPLVEFAMTRLWAERDQERRQITREGMRTVGGIPGALERYAEATFQRALDAGLSTDLLRRLLLALVTLDGTRATRSLEFLLDLGTGPESEVRSALAHLERARLVVRERSGIALAHDALLTQWDRLRAWLAEVQQDRLLAERLERAAAHWAEDTTDHDLLWRGRVLTAATELSRRGSIILSLTGSRFLSAGQRGRVHRRIAAGVLFALVNIAILGGIGKYIKDTRAESERARAESESARVESERARVAEREALAQEEHAESAKAELEALKKTVDEDRFRYYSALRNLAQALADKESAQSVVQRLQQRPTELPEIPPPLDGPRLLPEQTLLEQVEAIIPEAPPPRVPVRIEERQDPGLFNLGAAYAALQDGATRARACRGNDTSQRLLRLDVVFGNDGAVENVSPSGDLQAPPPLVRCLEGAFAGIRVPAFKGAPITAPKTVRLR